MTLEQDRERLAELISQAIDAHEGKLVDFFWKVIIDNIPSGPRGEIIKIVSRMNQAGFDVELKPTIRVSLVLKIMRSLVSNKVH